MMRGSSLGGARGMHGRVGVGALAGAEGMLCPMVLA